LSFILLAASNISWCDGTNIAKASFDKTLKNLDDFDFQTFTGNISTINDAVKYIPTALAVGIYFVPDFSITGSRPLVEIQIVDFTHNVKKNPKA
jgi:hypothetical protein